MDLVSAIPTTDELNMEEIKEAHEGLFCFMLPFPQRILFGLSSLKHLSLPGSIISLHKCGIHPVGMNLPACLHKRTYQGSRRTSSNKSGACTIPIPSDFIG